jgi:hypothetical protein
MSSRTTTGAGPELRPPKSAYAGDAVLHTITRSTVPMGQSLGAIEDSISQCTFLQMIYTAENPHADGSAAAEDLGAAAARKDAPGRRERCVREDDRQRPDPSTAVHAGFQDEPGGVQHGQPATGTLLPRQP